MSVFVDTGVFYAHHDVDASRHDSALQGLNLLLQSTEYGQVVTSDYVYDEAVTLTVRRTGRIQDGIALGRRIRGDGYPQAIRLLHATESVFDDAVETFETYDDHTLSFTDAMTIAQIENHGIDSLLSFDDDFDGILDRLDPVSIG